MEEPFRLWLEYEQYKNGEAPIEERYFNMEITLHDGRKYALNVWVIDAVDEIIRETSASLGRLAGQYSPGPDLLVRHAERRLLEDIVADLIRQGHLKSAWLVAE